MTLTQKSVCRYVNWKPPCHPKGVGRPGAGDAGSSTGPAEHLAGARLGRILRKDTRPSDLQELSHLLPRQGATGLPRLVAAAGTRDHLRRLQDCGPRPIGSAPARSSSTHRSGSPLPTAVNSQICSFLEDVPQPPMVSVAPGPPHRGRRSCRSSATSSARRAWSSLGRAVVAPPATCACCPTGPSSKGRRVISRSIGPSLRPTAITPLPGLVRTAARQAYATPGPEPDSLAELLAGPEDEIVANFEAIPRGVLARQRTACSTRPSSPT